MMQTSIKNKLLRHKPGLKTSKYIQCYIMIALPLIGFLVFTVYPYGWTAVKSWYYYTGNPSATHFSGWENFKMVFSDKTYWNSWLTTFKLTIYKLPIELPLAMLLAVLLNKGLRGSGFYRSMFFMPSVISVAILGLIVTNMFDYFGFVNAWLMKLNIIKEEIDWTGSTFASLTALMIGSLWSSFGINVMYFIAALSNIDEELYESAYIDGAGRFTIFFKITLPLMAPVLQTIILLALNGTLHCNEYILVTTNGAPGGTTHTVMSYISSTFLPGFAAGDVNLGYGSAMSLVTSMFMCLFAVLYSKLSSKMSNIY